MNEPTLHDIARGTTGAGDDDDFPSVYCDGCGNFVNATGYCGCGQFTIEHVHDASCNGTLELGETRLCGDPS
jgi:hypothetical protein